MGGPWRGREGVGTSEHHSSFLVTDVPRDESFAEKICEDLLDQSLVGFSEDASEEGKINSTNVARLEP